ncbi:unnamed protein product [Cuscuta campestris]|uniref:Uncharacterized protein n=1 Tax=Cuscuta campestris TaxID=132261 RepID=A0A484L217_9ASTE|nr:unnamed protein product [Cuscuta campestris]
MIQEKTPLLFHCRLYSDLSDDFLNRLNEINWHSQPHTAFTAFTGSSNSLRRSCSTSTPKNATLSRSASSESHHLNLNINDNEREAESSLGSFSGYDATGVEVNFFGKHFLREGTPKAGTTLPIDSLLAKFEELLHDESDLQQHQLFGQKTLLIWKEMLIADFNSSLLEHYHMCLTKVDDVGVLKLKSFKE